MNGVCSNPMVPTGKRKEMPVTTRCAAWAVAILLRDMEREYTALYGEGVLNELLAQLPRTFLGTTDKAPRTLSLIHI